MLVGK